MANVFDPMVNRHFNDSNAPNDLSFSLTYKLATTRKSITAEEWAFEMRKNYQAPLNNIFVIERTGEIGYVATGKFPIRKYNVAQGAYTKIGHMDENKWLGFVDSSEKVYSINPSKNFIVSANNFISSEKSSHGYSHSMAFIHRSVRINEIFDE